MRTKKKRIYIPRQICMRFVRYVDVRYYAEFNLDRVNMKRVNEIAWEN